MKITNEAGRTFNLKISAAYDGEKQTVEFFDADQDAAKFGPLGQFVSSYYADTLLDHCGGLDLCGHVPIWEISAENMEQVKTWIRAD